MTAPSSNQYTALVTAEHNQRPKFVETVYGLTQPLVELQTTLQTLIETKFDLDTAVGDQLDIIGAWVGRSRTLISPLLGLYFGFDEVGLGFDEAVWYGFPVTVAVFTASIAGSVLTVTAVASGSILTGLTIIGAGVANGTTIVLQLPGGTPGGPGTYTVSTAQTVGSETMTIGSVPGVLTLSDDRYRLLLRAWIRTASWDGSAGGLRSIWQELVGSFNGVVLVQDYGHMAMSLGLTGVGVDPLTVSMVSANVLGVKPDGVRLVAIWQATTLPVFGFDVDSPLIQGFDRGTWATILNSHP